MPLISFMGPEFSPFSNDTCHICYSGKVQQRTDRITDHSPRFHRIAQARLGNIADAEDAVQDALLSALTHMDQFRG